MAFDESLLCLLEEEIMKDALEHGKEFSFTDEAGIRWSLDKEHVLSVVGNGRVQVLEYKKQNLKRIKKFVSYIEKIDIAEGITSLGSFLFSDFVNLKEVVFPSTLKVIGKYAFRKCCNLKTLVFQDNLKTIDWNAFEDCIALEEVVLPNRMEHLEGAVFSGCSNLKRVVLPNQLKKLESYTFRGCSALEEIILPNTLQQIESQVFVGCTNLKQIILPKSVFAVHYTAFKDAGCEGNVSYKGNTLFANTLFTSKNKQKHIEIPNGIEYLSSSCFKDYEELESVSFPSSLKAIGEHCFSHCTNLKEFHLPDGIIVGRFAFEYCLALKHITLPNHCKWAECVFLNCNNLQSVTLPLFGTFHPYTFTHCPSLSHIYMPRNEAYKKLLHTLPPSCHVQTLDGIEDLNLRFAITEFNENLSTETTAERAKLIGLTLEEQLYYCKIVTKEVYGSHSYGTLDSQSKRITKKSLLEVEGVKELLVKDEILVGYRDVKGNTIFLGQICDAYYASDEDGTGDTYLDSVSHFVVD